MSVEKFLAERTIYENATQAKVDEAIDRFYSMTNLVICNTCDTIETFDPTAPVYIGDKASTLTAPILTSCRRCSDDIVLLSHRDLELNNLTWLPFGLRRYSDIPSKYFWEQKKKKSNKDETIPPDKLPNENVEALLSLLWYAILMISSAFLVIYMFG